MSGRAAAPQLALDLFNVVRHDFASFVPGPNAEALRAVADWAAGRGPRVVHLRGPAATGKTHLLQAAVAAVPGSPAIYVPLRELLAMGEQVLEGLEAIPFVAIDDLDACVGDAAWERRLFNLYNLLDGSASRLLWAARVAPPFALRDLVSRIDASLVYQLHELEDADKVALLRARARDRGLELGDAVVEFILRRERRDLATLLAILDELDRASLASARALTLPFVRDVLARRG